jgi:hypothetical protein
MSNLPDPDFDIELDLTKKLSVKAVIFPISTMALVDENDVLLLSTNNGTTNRVVNGVLGNPDLRVQGQPVSNSGAGILR